MAIPDVSAIVGGEIKAVAAAYFNSKLWQTKHMVTNAKGKNILASASVMSIEVNREKNVTSHPMESNAYIQDHTFTQPLQVQVELIVQESLYSLGGVYDALMAIWNNAKDTFCVVSDGVVYSDLVLSGMPQRKTTDKIDVVQVSLKFQEFIFVKTVKKKVGETSLAKNADLKQRGVVNAGSVSASDAKAMILRAAG